MSERAPIWELVEISKRFPGVLANDRVSLRLYPGEIHGLLGQNGCGKSTLIKTLCGAHQPDAGEIRLRGQPVRLDHPTAARALGIATVFQEFSLVPTLSVAENIHLGRLPLTAGLRAVDWAAMRAGALRVLRSLDLELDPDAVVGALSVAEQQLVEIAKAIPADASMLILDEPTTALGFEEIRRLHELLRRMKAQGRAILYISHRLDEVVEIVDVVTIMKDGRVVAAAGDSRVEIPYIVGKMMGEATVAEFARNRQPAGVPLLEARDLRTGKVRDVSFAVHRGEVLGLGGVLGSGRTEIARALFGVDRLQAGEIRVQGRPVSLSSPGDAIAAGLAYLPENRKSDGLFFNFLGPQNITIANLPGLLRNGFLDLGRELEVSRGYVRDLQISADCESKLVGQLSGGNQQKAIIARWLFSGAEVFILDEPTQGIDIGARLAVYRLIEALTAAGKGVVLISSDHDELLALSDRIAVVRNGTLVKIVEAARLEKTELVRSSADPAAVHHAH